MDILNIGFIGLGQIGKPMAQNLLKNQFPLTTCSHVRKESANEIERLGGKIVSSPAEVAQASDVTIIMVRDTSQTEEVFYGQGSGEKKGIWSGIKPGSIIVVCSTIDPVFCQKLAIAGKKIGVDILDAPVSGGYPMAESGTLTFLVGGERQAYEKCEPVFQAMGRNIYYLGGPGTGQVLKLVNNYMMIINAFGTSEALRIGVQSGLDLKKMLEIIKVSSGNSSIIQNWDMLAENQRKSSETETSTVPIFTKDMSLGVNYAHKIGVKADLGELVLILNDANLFLTEPLRKG